MHAQTAHTLTLHAKRLLSLPTLPPYPSDLIRSILLEIRNLDRDVAALLAPYAHSSGGSQDVRSTFNPGEDPATACALLVDHLSMRRDKRCLMAYHRVRVGRIEEAIWRGEDPTLPSSGGGSRVRGMGDAALSPRVSGVEDEGESQGGGNNLTPEETLYAQSYSTLLTSLKNRDELYELVDLTGSLEPPRDLFIDVRCVREGGEVTTEYGSIRLSEGSQFWVRRGDVEGLIRGGWLVRVG
ncbi:MAG: DNA replication protein psf1 [Chrysothrix sp. TS-e1954]|nr:MAG: DNA replication protein psf1 [Chrysothrix sp. TS-e1954]